MTITHFYSDPHFGHANILHLAERPFRTIEEHDLTLITRYKETVAGIAHPIVLWCGDCFFTSAERAADILRELPGTKLLVRGNHDKGATAMARRGFDIVVDELRMCIDGTPVRVSHYPYAGTPRGLEDAGDDRYLDRRPKRVSGEMLVHGHTHAKRQRLDNMIHVGVDAWGYRPASLLEVTELVRDHRAAAAWSDIIDDDA